MSKFYIDTEFIDDGKTIDLISIGIVRDDGREYYAQSVEFNPEKASDWVKDNVLSSLLVCPHLSGDVRGLYAHELGQCFEQQRGWIHDCPWRSRFHLRRDLLSFIHNSPGTPSFYGDYCAYDYVALCQLFGTMMDWPQGWPMFFHDLRQEAHAKNMIDISLRVPMTETEHNAISDARWIKTAFEFLNKEGER